MRHAKHPPLPLCGRSPAYHSMPPPLTNECAIGRLGSYLLRRMKTKRWLLVIGMAFATAAAIREGRERHHPEDPRNGAPASPRMVTKPSFTDLLNREKERRNELRSGDHSRTIAKIVKLAKLAPNHHVITESEHAEAMARFGDHPEFYLAAFVSSGSVQFLRTCLEKHPDSAAARYLLLGTLVHKRKAASEEFTQCLAKLRMEKGGQAYARIVDWLLAARSGDKEVFVKLAQGSLPEQADLIAPDYHSCLLAMLTEVCGLDLPAAFEQSRRMELQPIGIMNLWVFWGIRG